MDMIVYPWVCVLYDIVHCVLLCLWYRALRVAVTEEYSRYIICGTPDICQPRTKLCRHKEKYEQGTVMCMRKVYTQRIGEIRMYSDIVFLKYSLQQENVKTTQQFYTAVCSSSIKETSVLCFFNLHPSLVSRFSR